MDRELLAWIAVPFDVEANLVWGGLLALVALAAFFVAILSGRRHPDAKRIPTAHGAGSTAVVVAEEPSSVRRIELPRIDYEEDADVDPTKVAQSTALPPPAVPIVYDEDARDDEPTNVSPLIITSAFAQTDKGLRRKRNEDSLFVSDDDALYVVADGMGGHSGGDLASNMAVSEIARALKSAAGLGSPHRDLPKRASELARAIQVANAAIHGKASSDEALEGMGTTVCAARFSRNKQRLYVGHVGDSRVYRMRKGTLTQMTADHTMKDLGYNGPEAANLSRAVGVWPTVPIDVLLAKPLPGDAYLLCSDGLTKMVSAKGIARVLTEEDDPSIAVERLIAAANANGGKDNVTVILVQVRSAHARKVA